MRLLERETNGIFTLHEFPNTRAPAYAILSHTWHIDNKQEVSLLDVESDSGKSKAGWKKLHFCADRTAEDGLRYFWIDTCCIDKKNAVELSEAINSMFRWYKNAVKCYAYLSDISVNGRAHDAQSWEPAFRKSRYFTRGWTLQELIAPTQVDFYSAEGELLGTKRTLEGLVQDITGIARSALRGSDTLNHFSNAERMSWAERRNTTIEEDEIYSLLGIFGVFMPLVYGEGRENALRRFEEEIQKAHKGAGSSCDLTHCPTCSSGIGVDFRRFEVDLDLSTVPPTTQFVARKSELEQMHQVLQGHRHRSTIVLHGLGGMGKTQLAREYLRLHQDKYTATFWVNANDEGSIHTGLRKVAQQVQKTHPTDGLATLDLENDIAKVLKAVKDWLDIHENMHWLIVYDNYDNPKITGNTDEAAVDISSFLPDCDHGSIIITTRSAEVKLGQRIHVQKLPNIQEGLQILSNTSGRTVLETGM